MPSNISWCDEIPLETYNMQQPNVTYVVFCPKIHIIHTKLPIILVDYLPSYRRMLSLYSVTNNSQRDREPWNFTKSESDSVAQAQAQAQYTCYRVFCRYVLVSSLDKAYGYGSINVNDKSQR